MRMGNIFAPLACINEEQTKLYLYHIGENQKSEVELLQNDEENGYELYIRKAGEL